MVRFAALAAAHRLCAFARAGAPGLLRCLLARPRPLFGGVLGCQTLVHSRFQCVEILGIAFAIRQVGAQDFFDQIAQHVAAPRGLVRSTFGETQRGVAIVDRFEFSAS